MGQQQVAVMGKKPLFDQSLDDRQLLNAEQIGRRYAENPELIAIRYESVLEGTSVGPYVDLIFRFNKTDNLLIALGLPIRDGQLVWPQVYMPWSQSLLNGFSDQVVAQLANGTVNSGQFTFFSGFNDAFRLQPDKSLTLAGPGFENYWTIAQFLRRYEFIKSLGVQGRVLEMACGTGYGAGLLLKDTESINLYLGLDRNTEAVEIARRFNPDPRARFETGEMTACETELFDWIVSLDAIDHMPDPEYFLEDLKRHLKPDGHMVVSLSCERWHGFHLNRNHLSAWNLDRIRRFFQPHFEKIRCFTYDRPRFTEHSFAVGQIRELDWQEDRSRHEGYVMVLEGPRKVSPQQRIVVQRRYARGDALYATPIIQALRRQYPDHTLVVSTDVNDVFANNPDIDLLMATSSSFKPRPQDWVINLDEAYERQPHRHILDAYADVVGLHLTDPKLRLHLNRYDYESAGTLLKPKFKAWQNIHYLVAVHTCATPDRSWPFEHWKQFLKTLHSHGDIGVIVLGAKDDFEIEESERLISLVNKTDFMTTAACIALSDLVIGPDSSMLHVAAAMGTPAIGLYGMVQPSKRIPYAAVQTAIRTSVECMGCLHELPPPITNPRCKFGKGFCMEAISPEEVLKRFEQLLCLLPSDEWHNRFHLLTGLQTHQTFSEEDEVTSKPVVPRIEQAVVDRLWHEQSVADDPLDIVVIVRGDLSQGNMKTTLEEQWIAPSTVIDVAGNDLQLTNAQARSLRTDWILFLQAGDVCDSSLIAAIKRNITANPEWGFIYFDEAQLGGDGEPINVHYKPDFNLEYLRSLPFTGTAFAVRKSLFETLNGFDANYEGVEQHDFILRVYEKLGEKGIGHISGDLIRHSPEVNLTTRPLEDVLESGRKAVESHLRRLDVDAVVESGPLPATCRVRYLHTACPMVSIIIPTRNQRSLLDRCIQSLFAHTSWPKFEILVIDNGSDEEDAVEFLSALAELGKELDGRIRLLHYPEPFNYSAMNNLAAKEARGEYLLLLNNDTAALHDEWLDVMMSQAQRPDVGIVGAKLLFPDGKVQHAGVILGMKGPAEHPFIGRDAKDGGYYARLQVDQEYSAVTGACLLVRRDLYDAVGGLDEEKLAVSYNDIDLCLKIREMGKRVIWTPYAVLMHEGSKSQTSNVDGTQKTEKQKRFEREQSVMYQRWLPYMASDPTYNRNLSLLNTDFVFEDSPALRWDPDWRPAPRVISQPADREGCGEYRIIAPTRALINAGCIQAEVSERIYMPSELARIKPESLILQRQLEPHQIEAIERHKRFNDVFCVFEIDDLITNLPVKSAHKDHVPKDISKRMRRAVSMCDRFIVATEVLADVYQKLNPDIRVVPNYLERARWGGYTPLRGVGAKPRIGWAGGVSHTGDLELIEGVVEALKDEVEWVFLGMCPERLRPYVHEYHPPVSLDEYPAKLASLNLDLALAPLEEVPFNLAKSHLRLLEYGILGYPVICSDLDPYAGDYPVVRVRNRYHEWVNAIRELIREPKAANSLGDSLQCHVQNNWMLEDNLNVWLDNWLPN